MLRRLPLDPRLAYLAVGILVDESGSEQPDISEVERPGSASLRACV
jgi:hypothetical protein